MSDPAFEGVGQEEGIVIWRIEDFQVKSINKEEHGNFFSGDCYIILKTSETQNRKLEWNIHFWIGEESSQDESGTAAIKSVELDDLLGGSPVQHRETQNHESNLFLSYFKKGIRYLKGGVKSGFNHVTDDYVRRLLQVKGRRNVRLREVLLSASSLNNEDCFILDNKSTVYVYVGLNSGRMERIKAIQAANSIRDDVHCGRSVVKFIDENSTNSEVEDFFEDLGGGSLSDVVDASNEEDSTFEINFAAQIGLYRVKEENGNFQVDLIAQKALKQEQLDPNDCFILDGGANGLFVWIGKESSHDERIEAMNYAQKYIEQSNYPKWLPVQRIVQEAETPLFKSYFSVWKEENDQMGLGRIYTTEEIASSLPGNAVDLELAKVKLFSKGIGKAYSFMPDDGFGQAEIWRVQNFDIVPLDPSQNGIFFGGDCYIVKYTCSNSDGPTILYFWLGQHSSIDEKATAAMMTVKLDNEMDSKAVQVRVVHGQEPEHFLRIFQGKMVILMGGHASGFKNIHDYDSFDVDGTRLFQIKGTNEYNTRAEQVPENSDFLNSNDVFILEIPSKTYLWIGQDSCEEEHEMGRKLGKIVSLDREFLELIEGEEPEEFWESLGGKKEYPKSRELPSKPILKPRLFRLSNQTGKLMIEEICNFSQEDLCPDDVMILDSGDAVYLWIGNEANEEEKEGAQKLAAEYICSDPTDRHSDNCVIITVKQNIEPQPFKLFFSSWNPSMWEDLNQLLTRS